MAARKPRSKRGAQRGTAARTVGRAGPVPAHRDPPPGWVDVGRVQGARGLDGVLVVSLHGDDPANLLAATEVALQGGPGRIQFRVLEAVTRGQLSGGRARVDLRLAGLGSRETAREWAGASVSISGSALRALSEGEYYWRDLIGLLVRTPDGRSVGHVQEIWPTGGHDVLVVATTGDPVLVPAVEPVLMRVDLAAREIWIDPPRGLIPESSEPRGGPAAIGPRAPGPRVGSEAKPSEES